MDEEHKNGRAEIKTWETLTPRNLAVSFSQLGASTVLPPRPLLSNISGFVKKGGITAVMGPSASGKSLLLRALAGREPGLHFTGDVFMHGKVIDPRRAHENDIAFVPHEEFLISELTPRETIRNSFRMKRDEPDEVAETAVTNLMKKFGLETIADQVMGTMFKKVLSGGQRKRVEVCSELVAPSSLLLLDEPLSGLDGGTAYDILLSMRNILNDHNGDVSILMSIHQPNSRVMELFDHVLLLGEGGMLFFGTVPEAVSYFAEIGFPSDTFSPTDIFLRVTDPNFGVSQKFDFEGSFASHPLSLKLNVLLGDVSRYGASHTAELVEAVGNIEETERMSLLRSKVAPNAVAVRDVEAVGDEAKEETISIRRLHWRRWHMLVKQYRILFARHLTIAYRDPSIYILQLIIATLELTFVGGLYSFAHSNLRVGIVNRVRPIASFLFGICYLQLFKVFYLNKIGRLFDHEKANKTYYPFAFWLAELTASAIFVFLFIPGIFFGYRLLKFPLDAFPFLILAFWTAALTVESMLLLISRLVSDITHAVYVSAGIIVMMTVFNGQAFVRWRNCTIAWRWLQEIAVFTQGTRTVLLNIHDHFSYQCKVNTLGNCVAGGVTYRCAAPAVDGYCTVSGREAFFRQSRLHPYESKWKSYWYLVCIFVVCRMSVLILYYYPIEKVINRVKTFVAGAVTQLMLDGRQEIRRLRGQLNSHLINHAKKEVDSNLLISAGSEIVADAKIDAKLQRYLDPTCNSFEPLSKGCSLEWKDLSVKVKNKAGTVLVDKVSGAALPGRILAVMGPSGSGKTTLLNALSNRIPFARMEGEVTFGKREFLPSDLMYVPAVDEFNPNLTVLEQVLMVGELKCANRKEMLRRLNSLLDLLGLSDKVNKKCRDLTMGEIKRVSVGMGMVANPNVLLLDELDSSAAYSIVKFLRKLTSKFNVAVLIAIHQPAPMVFDLIHDVYLLYGGGRLAYYGPTATAAGYFKSRNYPAPEGVNPTDYMMDLMNRPPVLRGKVTEWTELYNSSTLARNFRGAVYLTIKLSPKAPLPSEPPSFASRLMVMMKFFVRYYLREWGMYRFRLAFLVVGACYMGSIYYDLRPSTDRVSKYLGAVYFTIWTVLFSALASTKFFMADFFLVVEQIKNAVTSPALYCISQFVVSLPFNLVGSVIFQTIYHFMTNVYPVRENLAYGIVMTWFHLLLMESGIVVAVTVFKNTMLAVSLATIFLILFLLLSGFVLAIPLIPPGLRWLTNIVPTRYSMLGYTKLVFVNQKFEVSSRLGTYVTGASRIAGLKIKEDFKPWDQLGILFAFVVAIRILHFILLWVHVYPYVKHQLSWSKFMSLFRVNSPFAAAGKTQATKSHRSATLSL